MNYFGEDRDETDAKIRETKLADSQRKSENTQIIECKCCGRKHCGTRANAQHMGIRVPSVVVIIILLRTAEKSNHVSMCMPFTKMDIVIKTTF